MSPDSPPSSPDIDIHTIPIAAAGPRNCRRRELESQHTSDEGELMTMLRLVSEDEFPGPPAVPHDAECVVCFVERMTRAYGCSDRLQWVGLWRDRCAPRATALEKRLAAKGGYCDCEVLMNAFVPSDLLRARLSGVWTEADDRLEAQDPAPCLGVRNGSSQACGRWVGGRRGTW